MTRGVPSPGDPWPLLPRVRSPFYSSTRSLVVTLGITWLPLPFLFLITALLLHYYYFAKSKRILTQRPFPSTPTLTCRCSTPSHRSRSSTAVSEIPWESNMHTHTGTAPTTILTPISYPARRQCYGQAFDLLNSWQISSPLVKTLSSLFSGRSSQFVQWSVFFIEPWFDHKIALSPDHSQPFIYLNGAILLLKTPNQQIVEIKCSLKPGPLKCFCAPRHQILAKSAPQKVRNRNKAIFCDKTMYY